MSVKDYPYDKKDKAIDDLENEVQTLLGIASHMAEIADLMVDIVKDLRKDEGKESGQ